LAQDHPLAAKVLLLNADRPFWIQTASA